MLLQWESLVDIIIKVYQNTILGQNAETNITTVYSNVSLIRFPL